VPFVGTSFTVLLMSENRTLEIANLETYIALWQQEERRLQGIVSSPMTNPEIRHQANERLGVVLGQIQDAAKEIAGLQSAG
jgi:hypothetical protein